MSEPTESDAAFPRLSDAQIVTLRAAGRVEPLTAGQVLFAPGDAEYDLVVLLSGAVEIVDDADGESASVLTRYGPRQFVGELNLITSEPVLLTGRVTQAGEGLFVSLEALRAVVARDPRLGDLILNALVTRRSLIIEAESGGRLIGYGSDPRTRALREFLTRNRVPYRFIDLDGSELAATFAADDLPVLSNGRQALRAPTILEAATVLNLRHPNKTAKVAWDCVIVGGGPAGLGAGVYAATEGLSTIMVDSVALGGQAGTSSRIENYLGFPAGISGADLADRAIVQARRFGLRTAVPERADSLRRDGDHYVIALDSGDELAARTVIVATGAAYRTLPLDGIEHRNGAGVFYAATVVEARMCGTRAAAVVGGGNSAGQAAIFLSGTTERVSLLLRGGDLGASMSNYLVEQIATIANIDVLTHTEVRALHGEHQLTAIAVEDTRSGERRDLDVGGLFVFIGADPCTDWLDDSVAKDEHGFLLTGADLGHPAMPLETSLPGVFAVGDTRSGSIKRVASAVGEGSMAVRLVHQHLARTATVPVRP